MRRRLLGIFATAAALMLMLILPTAPAEAATAVCGTIGPGTTTFTALGSPYTLCSDGAVVPQGSELVVDGSLGQVVIQAQPGARLDIAGSLRTQNTSAASHAVFRAKTAGDSWSGIWIGDLTGAGTSSATTALRWTDIADAPQAISAYRSQSLTVADAAVRGSIASTDSVSFSVTRSQLTTGGVSASCRPGQTASVTASTVDAAPASGIRVQSCDHPVVARNTVSNSGRANSPAPTAAIVVLGGSLSIGPGRDVGDNVGANNAFDMVRLSGQVVSDLTWVNPTNSSSTHTLGYSYDILEMAGGTTLTASPGAILKGGTIWLDAGSAMTAADTVLTATDDNSVGLPLCPQDYLVTCTPASNNGNNGVTVTPNATAALTRSTIRYKDSAVALGGGSADLTNVDISNVGTGVLAQTGSLRMNGGTIRAPSYDGIGAHGTGSLSSMVLDGLTITDAPFSGVNIRSEPGAASDAFSINNVTIDGAGMSGVEFTGATPKLTGLRVNNTGRFRSSPDLASSVFPAVRLNLPSGRFGPTGIGPVIGHGNELDAIEVSGNISGGLTWRSPRQKSLTDAELGLVVGTTLQINGPGKVVIPKDTFVAVRDGGKIVLSAADLDASAGGATFGVLGEPTTGTRSCIEPADGVLLVCSSTFEWAGVSVEGSPVGALDIVGATFLGGGLQRDGSSSTTAHITDSVFVDAPYGIGVRGGASLSVDSSTFAASPLYADAAPLVSIIGSRVQNGVAHIAAGRTELTSVAVDTNGTNMTALGITGAATVSCSAVRDNRGGGVASLAATFPTDATISDSDLFGNNSQTGTFDLDATTRVDARKNWWGQPGGPLPGQVRGATVDTSGALTAPSPCAPPRPTPTVRSALPSEVGSAGRETVTIRGSGFTNAAAVRFGSIPARSFSVVSDTEITATTPLLPADRQLPIVVRVGHRDVSLPNATAAITVTNRPIVRRLTPTHGPSEGGTTVLIQGANLTNVSQVLVGAVPVAFTPGSQGGLSIVTPPGSGPATVTVKTAYGTSPARPESTYQYDAPAPTNTTSTTSTTVPTTTSTTTRAPAPTTSTTTAPQTTAAQPRSGYWMVTAAGEVFGFGDAPTLGNAPVGNVEATDLEPTPSGRGYWVLDAAGHVFTFGDAKYLGGATALKAGEIATSLSRTPTGRGYWIFTTLGRVIATGDAPNLGDMASTRLNGPVLDSIPTPSGRGYYMVASDGGIFTFGDARFSGSMGGTRLNAPVQSLVPDGDGDGYWLVASDGGIFAFDANFYGSMGATRLNRPVTGMVASGTAGYLMVAEDGGIFSFGSARFTGSLGDHPPGRPVVAVAVLPGG